MRFCRDFEKILRFCRDFEKNYISLEDYLELEKFANKYFIDFVPNQNGFGHMGEWLKLDEFKHLANVEGLFKIWGSNRYSTTLDPTNEESYLLVKRMYDDMLPHSKSNYFNMNFDEPYELGHGKSKELCDKLGKEIVYATREGGVPVQEQSRACGIGQRFGFGH